MPRAIIINEGIHTALPHTYTRKWSFLLEQHHSFVEQGDTWYYQQVDQNGVPVPDPDGDEDFDGWCGPYKTVEICYREAFSLVSDWATANWDYK